MSLIYPNPPAVAAASGLSAAELVGNPSYVALVGANSMLALTGNGVAGNTLTAPNAEGAISTASKLQSTPRIILGTAVGAMTGLIFRSFAPADNAFAFVLSKTAGFRYGARFGIASLPGGVTTNFGCFFGVLDSLFGSWNFNGGVTTDINSGNMIGIGSDFGDVNFFMINRVASGVATKIVTGIPVAVDVLYEFIVDVPPTAYGLPATWTFSSLGFGATPIASATGTITNAALPSVRMAPQAAARGQGAVTFNIALVQLSYSFY